MTNLTALKRIPVPQWDALAHLQRAGGKANAAMMRAVLEVQPADLEVLVDQELVTCHRGNADVDIRKATFLPLIEVRLTPKGRQVGAHIVAMSGILLLLSRHRQSGIRIPRLIEASREPFDTIRELLDLGMVELVRVDGTLRPVDVSTVKATSNEVSVKLTGTGMRYTTEGER